MPTNNTKDGFTMVSNDLFNLGLSVDAIAVYVYMASKDSEWKYHPKEIRKALSIGDWKWRSATNELRDNGLYEVTKTTGGTVITLHRLAITGTRGKPTRGKPQSAETHTWETNALNNTNITNTKKESNTKGSSAPKKKFVLPETIDPDVWAEFEQHRKEIRKPLSDLARAKASNQLSGLSPKDQQQVVDYTITGRYTGLFVDRLQRQQSGGQSSEKFGGYSKSEIDKNARVGESYEQCVARMQRSRP